MAANSIADTPKTGFEVIIRRPFVLSDGTDLATMPRFSGNSAGNGVTAPEITGYCHFSREFGAPRKIAGRLPGGAD
jgi:hypothetical protein